MTIDDIMVAMPTRTVSLLTRLVVKELNNVNRDIVEKLRFHEGWNKTQAYGDSLRNVDKLEEALGCLNEAGERIGQIKQAQAS